MIGDNEENSDVEFVNDISINISNNVATSNIEKETEERESKSNLTSKDKQKIKEYLSGVYELSDENIVIH